MLQVILLLLAIIEGFVLSLSLPNVEIGIIPFIALVPSFFIIKYAKTYKGAFFLGWIVGITFVFFSFNWLIYPIDTLIGGASVPSGTGSPTGTRAASACSSRWRRTS